MSRYQILTEQRAALVSLRTITTEPLVAEGVTDLIARTDELLAAEVLGSKASAYLDTLAPADDDALLLFAGAATTGMWQ